MTIDIDQLNADIKYNCNISDSLYWGYLSLCSMLGRLKDLYLHEHGLLPWEPVENSVVLDWITSREELWETIENEDFKNLTWKGKNYNPFEAEQLNKILMPSGYVYGGGYATLNKPVFFLGELVKSYDLNGFQVIISGKELSRELTPPFAMHRGGTIHIRREPFIHFLHFKYRDMSFGKGGDVLQEAFRDAGLSEERLSSNELSRRFGDLADKTIPIILMHEIGEALSARNMGSNHTLWVEMVSTAADKITELGLRAIKDMLADTIEGGTIHSIVTSKDRTTFLFYVSFFDDLRKRMFSDFYHELRRMAARESFSEGDLEKLRIKQFDSVSELLNRVMEIPARNIEWAVPVKEYVRTMTG